MTPAASSESFAGKGPGESAPEQGPGKDFHANKGDRQTSGQKDLDRPTAEDIYRHVARNAHEELKRSSVALAISGVAGGVFMGLSGLGVALATVTLAGVPHAYFFSRMFYPLGFIVVIIGRAQLFTENTLYPVALVLAEKRQLLNTLRLWAVVLPSNVLGALAFAALIARVPSVPHEVAAALAAAGRETAAMPAASVFWTGVTAGWLIATAAWLVSGSSSVLGSVVLIWLLTFVVGLGGFAHCIASSGEILTAALMGQVHWLAYPAWLGVAVLGNICGGVIMVTLLEYGQAVVGKSLRQETEEDLRA